MKNLRPRFWVEASIGAASLVAFLAFLLWPTWIESLLRVSPDGGSGEAELYVAVVLALVAITCSVLMRLELRRARTAPEPAR